MVMLLLSLLLLSTYITVIHYSILQWITVVLTWQWSITELAVRPIPQWRLHLTAMALRRFELINRAIIQRNLLHPHDLAIQTVAYSNGMWLDKPHVHVKSAVTIILLYVFWNSPTPDVTLLHRNNTKWVSMVCNAINGLKSHSLANKNHTTPCLCSGSVGGDSNVRLLWVRQHRSNRSLHRCDDLGGTGKTWWHHRGSFPRSYQRKRGRFPDSLHRRWANNFHYQWNSLLV